MSLCCFVLPRENRGRFLFVMLFFIFSRDTSPIENKTPDITGVTAQKMNFSIKDFFSKCDKICRIMRIWSYLLKKSLIENFIFCAVSTAHERYS